MIIRIDPKTLPQKLHVSLISVAITEYGNSTILWLFSIRNVIANRRNGNLTFSHILDWDIHPVLSGCNAHVYGTENYNKYLPRPDL
jgi:hypothetical protein